MKHQFAYATSVKRGIRWLAKRDRKALLKIRDVPGVLVIPIGLEYGTILILDNHVAMRPLAKNSSSISSLPGSAS